MDEQYYDIERRTAVKESARELRRKFLRYKDAEIVYSMTHKKLLELAGKAGAIYRIDGYVLLDHPEPPASFQTSDGDCVP